MAEVFLAGLVIGCLVGGPLVFVNGIGKVKEGNKGEAAWKIVVGVLLFVTRVVAVLLMYASATAKSQIPSPDDESLKQTQRSSPSSAGSGSTEQKMFY